METTARARQNHQARRKPGRPRTREEGDGRGRALVPLNYLTNYSVCRDLRHSWDRFEWELRNGNGMRTLVCETCGTERKESWEGFRIVKYRYRYPPKYQLRGTKGLVSDVLLEVHRRLYRLSQSGHLSVREHSGPRTARVRTAARRVAETA